MNDRRDRAERRDSKPRPDADMEIGWMTDTLADLEAFAKMNGLAELQEQLQTCREIASRVEREQEQDAPLNG